MSRDLALGSYYIQLRLDRARLKSAFLRVLQLRPNPLQILRKDLRDQLKQTISMPGIKRKSVGGAEVASKRARASPL
jgi:hypothetical protein